MLRQYQNILNILNTYYYIINISLFINSRCDYKYKTLRWFGFKSTKLFA